MQKLKRPLVWLMLAILIGSMLPQGPIVQMAQAASAATYFIPDNSSIRNTALLSMDDNPAGSRISRTNVYTTNNGLLSVSGAFSYVSKDTMKVKIEQLVQDPVSSNWSPDSTHFTNGVVLEDTNSTNRFTASNLQLFAGMNRITFTGLQGSIERSDIFYVLFDKVPYLQNLKVLSGSTNVNLNAGTQVVVPGQTITLQGSAKNATKVTVSVNGGTPIITSLLDDGTFFSPALTLNAGLNTLQLSISNASDSVNVTRQVYYFDKNKPFTDVQLVHNESSTPVNYPLLNNIPKVTNGGTTPPGESGNLQVQLLVPYDPAAFGTTAAYTINGSASAAIGSGNVIAETVIPGADGITPEYKLVTFKLPADFNFTYAGSAYDKDQVANLSLTYGTFSATFNGKFKYLPNEIAINNIEYLPDFDGKPASVVTSVSAANKAPLNGAEVSSSTFYILVTPNKNASAATLAASYLPLSVTSLTLTKLTGVTGVSGVQEVYQVSGFANGQQKVQFQYGGSSTGFIADITYVSKSYIYISNLYDGQTFTFDSRQLNTMKIDGKYIGFESISGVQYFVNGNLITSPALGVTTASTSFSVTLNIAAAGPLVFGENRILFKGINTNSGGTQEIQKEIRVYIIDTNVSTISRFMPNLALPSREAFTSSNLSTYTTTQMANIFAVTPEFLFKDDKYVTSQKSYDLVLRGNGAANLNLKLGTQTFFSRPIPTVGNAILVVNQSFTYDGKTYYYDFAGDEADFILRIRDIPFPSPGSHVYNLELINGTGARTNQRLEIVREVSPYRILSPQPTVGNQIIVNKNFVRFDIEAEGATDVLINGVSATKRTDLNDRFVYDFVGLKPDKPTAIKLQIKQATATLNDTVQVYYSSAVQVDSQYMQKMANKLSGFNKQLELTFPKNTVLKSAQPNLSGVSKLYTSTNILFGIADPKDGVVERRNDYGNIINVTNDDRTTNGASPIVIPDYLVQRFNNPINTANFTRISQIYWINGGIGELGDKGSIGYKPATNGLAPYSIEGRFTEFEPERKVIPSNRGTLKIAFDPSVVQDVAYTVTVFRYNDRGNWENIGGEVDTKAHTITVPFDDFGYYMVAKLRKGFNDVTNHSWARNILNGLYSKGIMNNLRPDEFGADDQTTRGEFATLLVRGLNLPLNYDNSQTFFDVVPGSKSATWDYEHIETAARAGIVSGISEGFFGADLKITRQEAAVMIARGLQLKLSINGSKLEANLAKSFVDSGSIQYYARPAVEAVNKAKIMTGSPVTVPGQKKPSLNFNPKANMTRAEAGAITVSLLQKNTKIFPKNLS